MSYDLHWFRRASNSFLLDQGRNSFSSPVATASSVEDEKRQHLANEIMALDERFKLEPSPTGFSQGCSLGSDESDFVCPSIELGVGIVSMTLRGGGSEIVHNMLQVAEILFLNGYGVYDPHLDNVYIDGESLHNALLGRKVPKAKSMKRRWWQW